MDPTEMQMTDLESTEAPPMAQPEIGGQEVCIPLKALAQPDDADAMVTPEQGDSVTFTTDAVITRIEGENAYLKPSAINGTPIGEEAAPAPADADVAEGDALRELAGGGM